MVLWVYLIHFWEVSILNNIEIIGIGSGDLAKQIGVTKNYRGRTDLALCINGENKCPYSRILIRRKKYFIPYTIDEEISLPMAAESENNK